MGKSLLYAANTTSQAVAVGGVINFGNIVRRYGCRCTISGGNAIVRGSGYYDISTNNSFLAGGNGTVTLTLMQDGIAIPGGSTSMTVAAGSTYALTIPTTPVRIMCDRESTITAVITGVAGTVTSAAITAIKE